MRSSMWFIDELPHLSQYFHLSAFFLFLLLESRSCLSVKTWKRSFSQLKNSLQIVYQFFDKIFYVTRCSILSLFCLQSWSFCTFYVVAIFMLRLNLSPIFFPFLPLKINIKTILSIRNFMRPNQICFHSAQTGFQAE